MPAAIGKRRRGGYLLGFLACVGMMGYAYYAEYVLHLEPCPLCIFERVGVTATGLLFLIAALHGPRRWGARVYGVLLLLSSFITMGVSARHVWIQHLPASQVPACGAGLKYLFSILPAETVIRKVLNGSGECAKINWTLLGLSMPAWVFIGVAALAVLAGWSSFRRVRG